MPTPLEELQQAQRDLEALIEHVTALQSHIAALIVKLNTP